MQPAMTVFSVADGTRLRPFSLWWLCCCCPLSDLFCIRALTVSGLSINGELTRGQDVRTQNVMAVVAIANILKSSLGPVGLDKMLVDELGDMTVTNDGATILKNLEVEHPAAKVLVELSNLQDQEVSTTNTHCHSTTATATACWPFGSFRFHVAHILPHLSFTRMLLSFRLVTARRVW
jgi:hypothetical protein